MIRFLMPKAYLSSEDLDVLETTRQKRHKRLHRYAYYHQETISFLNKIIQSDSRVLWIGLDAKVRAQSLRCQEMYALELDPHVEPDSPPSSVHRVSSLEEAFQGGRIDYVVLPYTLQLVNDIQGFLEELHRYAHSQTRIIVIQYNFFWAPAIRLAQRLGLKAPMPNLNWLNLTDVGSLLLLTDFQAVTSGHRCLMPIGIPILTTLINRYLSPLPLFQWACQKTFVIARPLKRAPQEVPPIVSVVVPARNEAGNIQPLLDRFPVLGSRTEILFIEGHSKDNTWEVIQKQIQTHPRRNEFTLQAFQQTGVGKADAVRLGFAKAKGDIYMIVDADLSVQPEDLPHFYHALMRGSAEFLNGSRLIYRMEQHAMQVLNLFFNKVFAVLVSWLIGQSIKDTLCGTKVLYARDYRRIRQHLTRLAQLDPFGDFELLFGASLLNLKISDVAVRYKQRIYGQTNIRRFRNGWELLRMCLKSWGTLKA